MERREAKRSVRRLKVAFGPPGTAKRQLGFVANVSPGGMFIENRRLPPCGTRLRIEVLEKENPMTFEGVVAHTVDAAQALRRSRKAGIGVRFLRPDELLGALKSPDAARPAPAAENREVLPGRQIFRLCYADRQTFLEAYRRDITTGGLFIETTSPAAIDELVEVELSVEEPDFAPLLLPARVVHRFEPGGPAPAVPAPGMGVELLQPASTLEQLRALAARLQD